jgi:LysM repeat protein
MRLRLALMLLLAASLACNLSSPSNARPTTAPTRFVTQSSETSVALQPTIQSTTGTTCTPRTDWPTMTVGDGDTLSAIAARVGSTIDDLVAANCLSDPNAIVSGQTLYVPVAVASNNGGDTSGSVPTNNPFPAAPSCGADQWFFVFYPSKQDSSCPGPMISSNAAGENFEGGRVYWYDALPGSADTRRTIYVIYNDGTWETFVDSWDESQPSNDPSIMPPGGRFQPERGIGKLWRENTGVRGKLGWAYEPEKPFMGRRQSPAGNTSGAYSYIDHGWRNLALRLYIGSLGTNQWEVAGHY